ncbi:SPW repeat protein [Streptomyces sp. JJ36]|uniref:SPW repeat protein n=1 Tax=Streptomyces sp. JJ36 TaxID=2736645 RepID=UPI001F1CDAB2|nr:SPW repeat protein [Streptomyces sp. JJ36]MCF6521951.1 SPW repeat protein [Streptomyces sp. JJ36]
MSAPTTGIDQHPDLVAMRARYEEAASTPVAQVIEGLTFLAGVYLAISPWVVGFNGSTRLTASNLIVGIAFALLAVGFGSAYERTHRLGWTAPLLGVWIIISQWVIVGAPDRAAVVLNNVIAGGVAALCGFAVMGLAASGMRGKRGKRAAATS